MFDYEQKPYVTTQEAKCKVCKEPATTNIQQMDGTILGLCAKDYSNYLKRQREAIDEEVQ